MKKASDTPLISVIIPVYNTEKYINKCVNSVVNQTYKNLEIILVDDGSSDDCPRICDDWAKKDVRVKVIHKKNGGLSDARNAGVKASSGQYISFIDGDDYVDQKYISSLYEALLKFDADMSMVKHYVIYPERTLNCSTGKQYAMNPEECLYKMLYGDDVDVSAWAKLYKRELFKNISFPKGRLFEDSATTYKFIDASSKIAMHSVPMYYYIIRKNSITTEGFDDKKFDLITSTEEMCSFAASKYPSLKKACDRRLMYAYLSTLSQLAKSKKDLVAQKRLMNYIKSNRKKILADKNIPKRDRLALVCTKFGYRFFKHSWNIYTKIKH